MTEKFGSILLMAVLLAACTTFQAPPDDPQIAWELSPAALPSSADAPRAATLHVARPVPAAALATTRMAYQVQPFERRYYARNHWAVEPARLVHPHLVAALEEAGLFETVLSTATTAPADYRLETELLEITQDFRDREEGVARIELRARLVDLRAGRVLDTQRFEARADSVEARPAAGVAATSQALGQVLEALVAWVALNISQ